jgi:hypothetical protein
MPLTTVQDLLDYLETFPRNAVVFTNQFGGDFSEEHPINLPPHRSPTYYPDALVYKDEKNKYCYLDKQTDDDEVAGVQRPVLRLMACDLPESN